MQNQPSRLTFWRLVLATSGSLAWMAVWEAFQLARKLGIAPFTSKTWLALLGGLALVGAGSLLLLGFSFGSGREKLLKLLEGPERGSSMAGRLLLPFMLALYPVCLFLPYYGDLLTKQSWLRLFLFWMAALLAALGLKLANGKLTWPAPSPGWLCTCQISAPTPLP